MEFHGERTQIILEEVATDETVVVYTVPTGKKFWLIEAMLVTDAGATGTAEVEIRSATDVHLRHICWADVRSNNQGIVLGDHFEPGWPVEMSAGQDIAVTSGAASLEAQADIFGLLVDA